ncbi:hypothetical protein C0Z10_12310 [Acidipropionibacterium jensenii]|uniref:Uncharacterized protein n=1 Tax=Acidipropionibacterium jensenii TaxID=1749 RepID=A0A3T0S1Z0_9ACTN|nr:hypothetical protein C0Z10_12310 [Acidipropionibacterium jensenii]
MLLAASIAVKELPSSFATHTVPAGPVLGRLLAGPAALLADEVHPPAPVEAEHPAATATTAVATPATASRRPSFLPRVIDPLIPGTVHPPPSVVPAGRQEPCGGQESQRTMRCLQQPCSTGTEIA